MSGPTETMPTEPSRCAKLADIGENQINDKQPTKDANRRNKQTSLMHTSFYPRLKAKFSSNTKQRVSHMKAKK